MAKISRCAIARYAHELGIADADIGEFVELVNARVRREFDRLIDRLYRRYKLVAVLVNNHFALESALANPRPVRRRDGAAAVRIRKQRRRAKVAA